MDGPSSNNQMPFFDLIVIGGGSGGIATANRAASYGAKVALIEASKLGGTCVNLGCVPKKIMYCAASIAETVKEAPAYGFMDMPSNPVIDWAKLKIKRDAFITRLNGIYKGNLAKNGVMLFNGWGKLIGDNKVSVTNESSETVLESKNVLIAVGSEGIMPENIPGYDFGSTSDGFFHMPGQPKKVAIVGGGYIGVELSGVLNGLGTKVSLFTRKCGVLTNFDSTLQSACTANLTHSGVDLVCESAITQIQKKKDGMYIDFKFNGIDRVQGPYNALFWCIGRKAKLAGLGLETCGVTPNKFGAIDVDEYQNVKGGPNGLLAVGDATGVHMLTPVAIATGRKLADRLFGGQPKSKQDFENIPTVVFSHPPCGSIGMTEAEARKHYGSDAIKVYLSSFNDLYYSTMPLLDEAGDLPYHKVPSSHKLVCAGPEERVVGLHIVGRASDEILQGFAVAVKMGATKADFDRCIAIHPTASEELVTMK